jgi:hypothetical protein
MPILDLEELLWGLSPIIEHLAEISIRARVSFLSSPLYAIFEIAT